MSSASQKLFKTIVLHNKLMAEADLDALLQKTPEPDQVVRTMVARKIVAEALGAQLLALYRRKLEGLAPAKTPARAEPAAPGPAPAEPQAKPAPVAVVPPESAAVPPPQTTPPMAFETIQVGGDPVDIRHGGKELLHRLLAIARQANASDLHLKSDARPVVRVAALLRDIAMPPIPAAIVRETLLSALDDPQKEIFTRTNDLDFCYDAGPELGRFRTNYLVQHRGLDGIFRIINRRIPSLDELKLPPQIRRFCDYRQGLVLVTGPRACGKTTTLAALIDLINASRPAHIITIEDPIEFVHPCKKGHVNQRAVGPHTHSFSNALRATLREAPDVIMVGEMRDMG